MKVVLSLENAGRVRQRKDMGAIGLSVCGKLFGHIKYAIINLTCEHLQSYTVYAKARNALNLLILDGCC